MPFRKYQAVNWLLTTHKFGKRTQKNTCGHLFPSLRHSPSQIYNSLNHRHQHQLNFTPLFRKMLMSSILLEFVTKAHAYLSHCNVAHWLIHLQANIFGIRTYVLRCRHHIPLQYLLLVVLSLWSCWTICRISLRLERVVRTIKWRSEAVYYSLWWFFDRFLNMKISCPCPRGEILYTPPWGVLQYWTI